MYQRVTYIPSPTVLMARTTSRSHVRISAPQGLRVVIDRDEVEAVASIGELSRATSRGGVGICERKKKIGSGWARATPDRGQEPGLVGGGRRCPVLLTR